MQRRLSSVVEALWAPSPFASGARARLTPASISAVTRAELGDCVQRRTAFSAQRKDFRYYELVEDTVLPKFEYRYFVIRDTNREVRAIQPFFLLDQDLLAGSPDTIRAVAAAIRRVWPRFLYFRTLMVGCAAGEGHLDDGNEAVRQHYARLMLSALKSEAQKNGAQLIVLKEFPAEYRRALGCFQQDGYTRMPSLPMTKRSIDYPSFDGFMKTLSHTTRKDLRRKFRRAEAGPAIEMSVLSDISSVVDELYPLYLQVYKRSRLHFELLTKDYLCGLGQRLPDKCRFFIWRREGRVVAFSICMVQGETIYDEYIGLDYPLALGLHLYHYTFRDIVTWGIANGYKWYFSNGLGYAPKLHLRCRLEPLDLYVRHRSDLVNVFLKRILSWLPPTRFDKYLSRFPNYDEL